jgi:hypothetical protein
MGTISDKLMRIINTKEDIRQALISKGYDVPTSIPFKEYAKMILDLPCKVDSFPDIEGIVARYSASGLTNEQMAANPVWVDKTGNGHDLQMKNFAWGGMSGVGGYEMNFNLWTNNVPSIPDISMSTTTTSVSVSVGNSTYNNNLIYIHMNNWDVNKNHWLKVASTYEDGDLAFIFYNDKYTKKIELPANGYANIPAYPEFEGSYMYISTISNKQGSFTIEQLPLYPGFILGDGVDDFAVTEKELNFEDTYTVYTAFIPFRNNPTRNMILCGADSKKTFSMQYSSLVYVSFIAGNNYYINANFVNGLNLFACKRNGNNICIKNLLTNKVVTGTCGDWVENAGLYYLWKNATYASFARAAIAGQTICNGYFSTDEDDEKVLDWYKKQYPWLFPDQAWTVTGKTNEDEDRATIANITGNGNDLVLSNFGFAEGSGYNEEGEYAGYLVTDGVDDKIISSIFKMGNDWTVIGDWELINTGKNDNAGIVKFDSIVIYNYNYNSMLINIKNGRNILIPDQNTVNAICSDGRIYSKDWKESIYNEETESTSKNFLTIGYSGNAYTKIAFKNLAIYPTVLSREDCIKAYNYLQTLKAK